MRRAALALVALVACGGYGGDYSVTASRISGTCPESTQPQTWSIGSDGVVTFPGSSVSGGCPLTWSGDRLSGRCEYVVQGVTLPVVSTLDLTFSDDRFTGTESDSIPAGTPGIPLGCSGAYSLTGTRR
jgi:hypothetical protein